MTNARVTLLGFFRVALGTDHQGRSPGQGARDRGWRDAGPAVRQEQPQPHPEGLQVAVCNLPLLTV